MRSGWRIGLATLCLGMSSVAAAQPAAVSPASGRPPAPATAVGTVRLWPGRAPGAESDAEAETPTLTLVRPWPAPGNGTAVVIAPGGGYVALSRDLEGQFPAAWFASRGVTAFVLTYRVGPKARLPIPLLDGARAIRFVRAHAAEWGVDPSRIGMMGFSAGGHLAATTAVEATPGQSDAPDPVDRVSSRPDFLILAYPWLEATGTRPDGGSSYCDFALRRGGPCHASDYAGYAPLRKVTAAAPPTFIYHTSDDELVPVEGSLRFFAALRSKGVSAELHVFRAGHHGSGLGGADPALSQWPTLLQAWLRGLGLLTPARDSR